MKKFGISLSTFFFSFLSVGIIIETFKWCLDPRYVKTKKNKIRFHSAVMA